MAVALGTARGRCRRGGLGTRPAPGQAAAPPDESPERVRHHPAVGLQEREREEREERRDVRLLCIFFGGVTAFEFVGPIRLKGFLVELVVRQIKDTPISKGKNVVPEPFLKILESAIRVRNPKI